MSKDTPILNFIEIKRTGDKEDKIPQTLSGGTGLIYRKEHVKRKFASITEFKNIFIYLRIL